MRFLTLGGGGPIGQAIGRAAVLQGHAVFWASRQPTDGKATGRLQLDRRDIAGVLKALIEHRIDVLVDLTAYALADTGPLVSALPAGLARYVLISSGDVYRNYGLLHRLETGAPDQSPLGETAPERTSRFPYRLAARRLADDPQAWMDDYDKLPIEAATRSMTCPWTILRLPMVYGPGDRQRRFRWAIEPMLLEAPRLETPTAWRAWITTYGFIDNVAAAVVHAATHPRAMQATFNVNDETPVTHEEWLERFRNATGWQGELAPAGPDSPFSRAIAPLDLSVPFRVSSRRLFEDLGFVPPVDLATRLRVTIADEANRPGG